MRSKRFDARKPCIRSLVLVGLMLAATAPAVAVTAYTITEGGSLYAINPYSGAVQYVGNTRLGGFYEVATSLAGDLYAVRRTGVPVELRELYLIDRATAAADLIGSLGVDVNPSDLAADSSGGLWMAADGDLYSVDPLSGAASLVGPSGDFLSAVAFRDGVLYGIALDSLDAYQLVTVDMGSGALTAVSSLDPSIRSVVSMDFEASGALWVLEAYTTLIAPPVFITALWLAPDLDTGAAEEHARFEDGPGEGPVFTTLAIAPGAFDAFPDVPALGASGMAVLALLLAAVAWASVRRRGVRQL